MLGGKLNTLLAVVEQQNFTKAAKALALTQPAVSHHIRELEEDGEKRAAIEKLARKYAPNDTLDSMNAAIERDWAPLCMLEMSLYHINGKEAIELVKAT